MGNVQKSSLNCEVKLLKAEIVFLTVYNNNNNIIIMHPSNNFHGKFLAISGPKLSGPSDDPDYRDPDYRMATVHIFVGGSAVTLEHATLQS
jgi:hypothetical protein